jgi:hypothetical protein
MIRDLERRVRKLEAVELPDPDKRARQRKWLLARTRDWIRESEAFLGRQVYQGETDLGALSQEVLVGIITHCWLECLRESRRSNLTPSPGLLKVSAESGMSIICNHLQSPADKKTHEAGVVQQPKPPCDGERERMSQRRWLRLRGTQ